MRLETKYRWRILGGKNGGWYLTRWYADEASIRELHPEAVPGSMPQVATRLETDAERAAFPHFSPHDTAEDRERHARLLADLPEPSPVPAPPPPDRSHEEVMLAIRAAHPETIERDFEAQCRVSILLREHGMSRFTGEQIVAAEWHVRQALEAALQGPVHLFNAVRSVEVARDRAMSHLSLSERQLLKVFVGAYRRTTDTGRALLGGGRDFWFQVATAPVLYSLRAPVQREPEEPTPPAAPATMQQAALF